MDNADLEDATRRYAIANLPTLIEAYGNQVIAIRDGDVVVGHGEEGVQSAVHRAEHFLTDQVCIGTIEAIIHPGTIVTEDVYVIRYGQPKGAF